MQRHPTPKNEPLMNIHRGIVGILKYLLALTLLATIAARSNAAQSSDITIEVGGDLQKLGGVVVVYPLPVRAEDWAKEVGENRPAIIRVEARYAEVQFRYPADQTYNYRFRLAQGTAQPESLMTAVLTVIGTDEQGKGAQMKFGFKDAFSSGGRIIRVLPFAEVVDDGKVTKSDARWGVVVGYDALPPADERSARELAVIMEEDRQRPLLSCAGGKVVQACTVALESWPIIDALWWRGIAKSRLERLQHHALRRCYDGSGSDGGHCDPTTGSNEPEFTWRK